MNNKQNSIYTTGKRLKDLYEQNKTVVDDIPGLSILQTELTGDLSLIETVNDKTQTDTTLLTARKAALRSEAVARLVDLNNKMLAFATMKGDTLMMQQCGMTVSSYQKLNDNEFMTVCRATIKMANTHLTDLEGYKVTTELIAAVQAGVDAFAAEINKPSEVRNEMKQYNAQLAELFSKVLMNLDRMDIMVEAARNEYPAFYTLYQNTREVNYRHGSLAAQGCILDAKTGEPVVGAKVSFVLEGTEVLIKISGESGCFKIKSMEEGSYLVTVTKTGYKPKTITIYVTDTELVNVDVSLERL